MDIVEKRVLEEELMRLNPLLVITNHSNRDILDLIEEHEKGE